MSATAHADRRWWIAAFGAVLAVGLITRFVAYATHHMLGFDEVLLALNLPDRSYSALARPLAFEQTAPLLFLWAAKTSVALCGLNELALRALPFVAGIALIPLVWLIARQLLRTPQGAAIAAASAAVCPIGVTFANVFKPYAVDATVTALLLLLTLRLINGPGSRSAWWVMGAVASIAPFFSAPSVFVTAAAIAAIPVCPAMQDRRNWQRLAVLAGACLTCFGLNFFLFQRTTIRDTYLQVYWRGAFFTPPVSHMAQLARARIGWTIQELYLGLAIFYPAAVRILLVVVALTGLVAVTRRRGSWALMLTAGPMAAVVMASAVRVYPLSERTLFFAAPIVLISVAAGLEALAGAASKAHPSHARPLVIAMGILLLAPATVDSVLRIRDDLRPDAFRDSVEDLRRRARPSAPTYLGALAVPIWIFYTTDWRHPDTARVRQLSELAASTGPNAGNSPSRGHPVDHEGADLVVHTGARDELIGVPTGMQVSADGTSPLIPDRGWATNEASRIRAAANPDIWVVFSWCHNMCDSTLIDTLTASAGHIAYQRKVRGVRIYEYVR